ncbi:hypothetical protein [Nocardia mexicana]|uniref:hypothetical protein n=1 Tax=Nocardia mexicana TaxID=279262 RepID=UPI0012F4A0CB|nr:hypothetical protein [Nocardia mexicana]
MTTDTITAELIANYSAYAGVADMRIDTAAHEGRITYSDQPDCMHTQTTIASITSYTI